MTDHSNGAHEMESPMKKLAGLSPDRGSTNYKQKTYTPQKLENNYMYKEVTIIKKLEPERNKIRQLDSLNALLSDNNRHLNEENDVLKANYQKQIEMYKRMLREQEEETKRLLKNLQNQYSLEIKTILERHEEDSRFAQGEKEELERKIEQLNQKIYELEGHLRVGNASLTDLDNQFKTVSQKLIHTQSKYHGHQNQSKLSVDQLSKQLQAAKNKIIQDNIAFKEKIDALGNQKTRQLEALQRQHLVDLDKVQNRRNSDMNLKHLQLNDLKNVFDNEGRRLDQIIVQKDRMIDTLSAELKKEKEKSIALARNYDLEIGKLINEKDYILSDFAKVNDERNLIGKQLSNVNVMYGAERDRNALVVSSLHDEIQKKNMQLAIENQKLLRTVHQYQNQLMISNKNSITINKTLEIERSEEVRRLALQIRNLKAILGESSSQMERCRSEFLRMQLEIDHLMRTNRECEAESLRLRALIAEQDVQLRLRRI